MKAKVFIVVIIILFIIFFIFNTICIYKLWYMEPIINNDISQYTEGYMIQYDGGIQALNFFPKYSEITGAKNIYFHHEDSRQKNNFYHKYFCVFILDIEYNEKNMYMKVRNDTKTDLGCGTINDYKCLYEVFCCEDQYAKGVYCNDDEQVIRYVLIYGEFDKKRPDMSSLILWNSRYW